MRGIFGLLIVGSLLAIGTAVFGGLDNAYDVGSVATISGTKVLFAGLAVIAGSVAALSSVSESTVDPVLGVQTDRVVRPGLIALAVMLFVGAGFLVFGQFSSKSVIDLTVGDCFDNPSEVAVELTLIELIPCDEPHDSEVYANLSLDDMGSAFPGASSVEREAIIRCLGRFDGFIGASYDTSIFDIIWLSPTTDSWSQGDRSVTCAVYRLDGQKSSGSARNIGA